MMHLTKYSIFTMKRMENKASYSTLIRNVQKIAFSIILENYLESVLSPLVSKSTIHWFFFRKSNKLLYSLWYLSKNAKDI